MPSDAPHAERDHESARALEGRRPGGLGQPGVARLRRPARHRFELPAPGSGRPYVASHGTASAPVERVRLELLSGIVEARSGLAESAVRRFRSALAISEKEVPRQPAERAELCLRLAQVLAASGRALTRIIRPQPAAAEPSDPDCGSAGAGSWDAARAAWPLRCSCPRFALPR